MQVVKNSLIAATLVTSLGAPLVVVPNAGATKGHDDKMNACTAMAVGTENTAGGKKSRFTIDGNKVTAKFVVSGKDCAMDVTLATWKAPNPHKGRPYSEQKLYKHSTGTFTPGTHTLTAELPDCYYQVDLTRGKSPTGPNGSAVYEKGRLMGSLHGGTQKCDEKPVTPETPAQPTTPTPIVEDVAPKELPDAGPASLIATVGLSSVFAGVAHNLMARRRVR